MADIILETPRLILRTEGEGDRAAWAEHLNTPAVTEHLNGVQQPDEIDANFDRLVRLQAEHGHSFLLMEHKASGDLLGFCGLKRVDAKAAPMQDDHEIGWRLRQDYWRQGLAEEAARATLDYAFGTLGAPHVVALTTDRNEPSWRMMDKLGMKRRPDLEFVDPDYPPEDNPTIVYRIDRTDWVM